MKTELMCLKESAVDLLADVAAGHVYWIVQRSASYAMNSNTGRRCTSMAKALELTGAIRKRKPTTAMGPFSADFEPTEEGREALAFHRPDRATVVTAPYAAEAAVAEPTFMDDYRAGRATVADIDNYIDQWHDDPNPFGPKLHDYLGLTWEQFKHWGSTTELPSMTTGSQAACLLAGDGEHDCADPTAEGTCRYGQGGGPR